MLSTVNFLVWFAITKLQVLTTCVKRIKKGFTPSPRLYINKRGRRRVVQDYVLKIAMVSITPRVFSSKTFDFN